MTSKACLIKLIKSYVIRILQCVLFWVPVKKNRIMVYSHARRHFSCNPKYIVLALQKLYKNQLEIIWITSHPECCAELHDMGIRVMDIRSSKKILTYLRTRVYITTDSFPHWALHRANQLWINTWHGGINYKHIGLLYLPHMSVFEKKLFRSENREPDIYLSGSQFFSQDTAASFQMRPSIFIPTGLPRNDLFFKSNPELKKRVMEQLRIPLQKNILMYAPSFRENKKKQTHGMDFERLVNVLEKRFGGEWIVLFRSHAFVEETENDMTILNSCSVTDVSDYPDMQELLFVSDILISDFSSCMWDFCLTKRLCFSFIPDLDNYKKFERGFACPMEKWPFSIAENMQQLEENIRRCDPKAFARQAAAHLKEMGSFDRGNASTRTAQIIGKFCGLAS